MVYSLNRAPLVPKWPPSAESKAGFGRNPPCQNSLINRTFKLGVAKCWELLIDPAVMEKPTRGYVLLLKINL